jgi:hypothetical protein
MKLEFAVPALELSTAATLLLVFNNRLLAVTQLVRDLSARYRQDPDHQLALQIRKMYRQVILLRDVKIATIVSILLCIVTMFLMSAQLTAAAAVVFTGSLITLGIALVFTIAELFLATGTLNLALDKNLKNSFSFSRKRNMPAAIDEQLLQEPILN